MTEHLRQIHDACGKLVLYHIVMMFLLKEDEVIITTKTVHLPSFKFTIFAYSPVHTYPGTFETAYSFLYESLVPLFTRNQ